MIDIIICTYNRPDKVAALVSELKVFNTDYSSIILVDSSDTLHSQLSGDEQLQYIHSPHKNQPFQRYLGFLYSKAEILIYLDDDMEIANPEFLKIVKNTFQDSEVSGMVINFKDKHVDTALANVPESILRKNKAGLVKLKNWLSGYAMLPEGKFGLCGLRGKHPLKGGSTEWLSGGAFAAKREVLFENFNFQLFDLFEQKMGMGEDAIIGYGLSKHGKLMYIPTLLFYHNDQKDSTYTLDHFKYTKRVVFSRLYLSLEKARLDKATQLYPRLFYHWHTMWRITGLLLNYCIDPSSKRKRIFMGGLMGWMLAFRFRMSDIPLRKKYWQKEAKIE